MHERSLQLPNLPDSFGYKNINLCMCTNVCVDVSSKKKCMCADRRKHVRKSTRVQLLVWKQLRFRQRCETETTSALASFRRSDASPDQGLTFRRNFAEISIFFSFPLVTGIRNFGIFRYISFQNSKFNKFRPKSTEISERNFVSAKHQRDFIGKRNG